MRRKSSLRFSHLFLLLCLVVAVAAAYYLLHDMTGPQLAMNPAKAELVGPSQQIQLKAADESGLRSVEVVVRRGDRSMIVLQQQFAENTKEALLTFDLSGTRLPDGPFSIEVSARDMAFAGFGVGNSSSLVMQTVMDAQPPRLAVRTVPPAIRRGGSALIVYTVNKPVKQTGVRVDENFFPAYQQPDGSYICLFAFPHFKTTATYAPEIMARDMADNETSTRLLVNAIGRTFPSDTLPVDERFLTRKAEELGQLCPDRPDASLLDQYICVNNGERQRNNEMILRLGQKSQPSFIWEGRFQALPRSAVMAHFGDARTYVSGGKEIDHQVHEGLDLASVARAEVPAANEGQVVFAGELGIYGNVVIIDHGLGLMTLYSHLTEIRVAAGDSVKNPQIIGTTGTTGLAAGDHVHFGVLVSGVAVQPLEWLDPKWVKNNITSRLPK